jgi:long-chain acyl-CoA synthetase
MLTHSNLIADAAGTAALLDEFQPGDRHISYLPLAHIYERNNMTVGCGVAGWAACGDGGIKSV